MLLKHLCGALALSGLLQGVWTPSAVAEQVPNAVGGEPQNVPTEEPAKPAESVDHADTSGEIVDDEAEATEGLAEPTREPPVDEGREIREALRDSPCDVQDVTRFGEKWYVACGSQGLWVLEEIVKQSASDASRAQVITRNKRYVVLEAKHTGLSLMGTQQALSGVIRYSVIVARQGAAAATDQPRVVARTVGHKQRFIQLKWVGLERVEVGVHLRWLTRGEQLVGEVTAADAQGCTVEIGLGETPPPVGTPVVASVSAVSSPIVTPKTPGFKTSLAARVRVGADTSNSRFMINGNVFAERRFRMLRWSADLSPLAVSGKNATFVAVMGLGYVGRRFGFDVLGGAARINYFPVEVPGIGPVFGASARLGHEDGLHVEGRFLLGVLGQQMILADSRVMFQVPLTQRAAAVFEGYHGRTGVSGVDLGVKAVVLGNHGPGSLIIHGSVGPMMTFRSTSSATGDTTPEDWGIGPVVGFGAEYRF